MTNHDIYEGLTEDQKKKFLETYSNHPLADYIDWKAFYASSDGNEMHFVKALRVEKNDDGDTVYVLKRIVEDNQDMELLFNAESNAFETVPARG